LKTGRVGIGSERLKPGQKTPNRVSKKSQIAKTTKKKKKDFKKRKSVGETYRRVCRLPFKGGRATNCPVWGIEKTGSCNCGGRGLGAKKKGEREREGTWPC